mgnify:CR=1 FL=1
MKHSYPFPLAALAAALLTTPALAQLTIVNPGFESPNVGLTDISGNDTTPTGWTAFGSTGRFIVGEDWVGSGSSLIPAASSGDQSFLTNQGIGQNGIYQSIGTVEANTDYSFSFEVGKRNDQPLPAVVEIGLWGDTDDNGVPDTALIELGLSDIGTPPDGTTGQETMAVISSSVVNSSTFDSQAIGKDLFFYISTSNSTAGAHQILFDNVAAIPEPSTTAALLGGLGLTLVLLRRRR